MGVGRADQEQVDGPRPQLRQNPAGRPHVLCQSHPAAAQRVAGRGEGQEVTLLACWSQPTGPSISLLVPVSACRSQPTGPSLSLLVPVSVYWSRSQSTGPSLSLLVLVSAY